MKGILITRNDRAIADCTQAVTLNPNDGGAYYVRAKSYEKKGETTKAQADFAQAEKLGYEVP
ncbi:MAG: hypothetical protein JW888_02670 [Pirellulales bacterium]|nr:hypothetical protein [Pirellulales bacterium]